MSVPRPNGWGSLDRITVPCGKCIPCLANRRQMWAFRLKQELLDSDSAFFITLTYNDEHLPKAGDIPTVSKSDMQKFFKRLRKAVDIKEKNDLLKVDSMIPEKAQSVLNRLKRPNKGIRYFCVSEYGPENKRPHYHLILFNLPGLPSEFNLDALDIIQKAWSLDGKPIGFVNVGTVTEASIMYCAKYCINKNTYPDGALPPFYFCRLGSVNTISLVAGVPTMK